MGRSASQKLFSFHDDEPSPSGSALVSPSGIYTSNFAGHRKRLELLPEGLRPVPVSIACGTPRWFTGKRMPLYAPSRELLSRAQAGKTSMLKFWRELHEQAFGHVKTTRDLKKIVESLEGLCLLCWCKPNVICHRRMIAEWIEKSAKIVIPELGFTRDQTESHLNW